MGGGKAVILFWDGDVGSNPTSDTNGVVVNVGGHMPTCGSIPLYATNGQKL